MAEGRNRREPAQSVRYRVPAHADYNEFVGVLGPTRAGVEAELHVRFGVKDGLYADWSISLVARLGRLDDFRRVGHRLERRVRQRVSIDKSTIREQTFAHDDPSRSRARIVEQLHAGDLELVDNQYQEHLASLHRTWTSANGEDHHTEMIFGYARTLHDDPDFSRCGTYSWVKNTVLALDEDQADDVIAERAATYFTGRSCTAGIFIPRIGRMKFLNIGKPDQTATANNADTDLRGNRTMGMLAAHPNRGDNWTDNILT